MSARRAFDPVGNFNFTVELDGVTAARFAAVDGLAYEQEAIEYRVSDDPMTPRYRPGMARFGVLKFKRGFTGSWELGDWLSRVRAGIAERRDLTITVLDNAGESVAAWHVYRCLPTRWSVDGLDGQGGDNLYESIEMRMEGCERVGRYRRRGPSPADWSGGRAMVPPPPGNARGKTWTSGTPTDWSGGRAMATGLDGALGSDGHAFDADVHEAAVSGGLGEGLDAALGSDGHTFDADAHEAAVSGGLGEGLDARVQSDGGDEP